MAKGVEFNPTKDIAPVDLAVAMGSEDAFNATNAEIVKHNSLFSLGQEAIHRAVIESEPEQDKPIMVGAQFYSVMYRLANPENALNGPFRPGHNVEIARKAAGRVIPGSKNEYWDSLLKTWAKMNANTPETYAFFHLAIPKLTVAELNLTEKSHDVIYGVALMQRVHFLGERALLPPWRRLFWRV